MTDAYRIPDDPQCHEDFCTLLGPDGFVCRLGEPEDCSWVRDGESVVARLNEQHRRIQELETNVTALRRESKGFV